MKVLHPELKRLIIDMLIDISIRDIKRGASRSAVISTMSRFNSDISCEVKRALIRGE